MAVNKKLYEQFEAAMSDDTDTSPYDGVDVEVGKDIGDNEVAAPVESPILGDLVDAVADWGKGAVQGLQEMTRAGDQLATSNPLALTSPDTVRAPINTTTEQQEDTNWYLNI